MPRCAFLTISNTDGWFIDDDLVHEPLQQLGWKVQDIVWTDDLNWDEFDVVVIRSPWDYQDDLHRFLSVLQQIDNSSATLHNSLNIVQWNIDKHYLFDLQRGGIEIVPTLGIETPARGELRHAIQVFGADQIILKPTIGANADDTFRVSCDTSDSDIEEICEVLRSKPCLAQPFMQAIVNEGEYSLIYIDGCLSHSVLKTASEGDFRVQEEHGGGVLLVQDPEPGLIAAGERVIATLAEVPLYARVDLVRTQENTFALMELELVEPSLYFRFADHAADAFAASIAGRYARASNSD